MARKAVSGGLPTHVPLSAALAKDRWAHARSASIGQADRVMRSAGAPIHSPPGRETSATVSCRPVIGHPPVSARAASGGPHIGPVVSPLRRQPAASTMSKVPRRNRPCGSVTACGAMIKEGLMNESFSFSGSPSKYSCVTSVLYPGLDTM